MMTVEEREILTALRVDVGVNKAKLEHIETTQDNILVKLEQMAKDRTADSQFRITTGVSIVALLLSTALGIVVLWP